MLISIAVWIFTNWLPLYFQETYRMSLGGAGFSGAAVVTAGVVAGLTVGGWLSDRAARRGRTKRMLLHSLCDLASVPFLFVFLAPAGFVTVGIAMLGFSLFRALGQANAVPVMYDVIRPRDWSASLGLMNMGNCIAGGAGILLTGYLKSAWGLQTIFAIVPGIVVICSVLLWIGYRWFLSRDFERRGI